MEQSHNKRKDVLYFCLRQMKPIISLVINNQMLTTNQTVLFYQSIVNSPQLLAGGYKIISSFLLEKQENRRDTLLNLLNPQVPILSLVMNVYPIQVMTSPSIEQAEKDNTVEFLLNLVTQQLLLPLQIASEKKISQLMLMLHKIHNIEGFQRWAHYYMISLSRLQVSNQKIGYFLINVLKHADDRVSILSQELLRIVVRYQFSSIEQQLQIFYYILKSVAYKIQTDPEAIEAHIQPYLNDVIQLTCNHINQNSNTLRFSLKILTLLVGDYQVQCSNELVRLVQNTALGLITSYISLLNNSLHFERGENDFEEQEQQPIQIALYQMLQLFNIFISKNMKLQLQIAFYLGIISTYLPQSQYMRYVQFPDQYLMDVDDQGEANIRNRSIFYFLELFEHQKMSKKAIVFVQQYTLTILANLNDVEKSLMMFLQKHHLPHITLRNQQLYRESMLFVLYSFTQQLLQGNTDKIFATLGLEIKNSDSSSIQVILSTAILNKCLKQTPEYHSHYLSFLREIVNKYSNNIGMLIIIARGIYEYSPQDQLLIVNSFAGGVPNLLVANLFNYLQREDSAQMESAYLILQFFIHLLEKCEHNRAILQQLIDFNQELLLLKKFLNTGMNEQLVSTLTYELQNPITLSALYKEIQNGYSKDESLSKIISKSLRKKTIFLTQQQVMFLCQVYSNRLDIITQIVTAFIQENQVKSNDFVVYLSKSRRKQWIPGLLKQNKLMEIERIFLESVNQLTNSIESVQLFQNQLLVPFYFIATQTENAISMLNHHNLLASFIQKLYKYAKLFQGTHLKIVTSHIFIVLAQKMMYLTPKVIELIRSYGKIESNQWEDENSLIQFGTNQNLTETVIQRMFDNIVNERVEQVFKLVFGDLSWDSQRLYERLAILQSRG